MIEIISDNSRLTQESKTKFKLAKAVQDEMK